MTVSCGVCDLPAVRQVSRAVRRAVATRQHRPVSPSSRSPHDSHTTLRVHATRVRRSGCRRCRRVARVAVRGLSVGTSMVIAGCNGRADTSVVTVVARSDTGAYPPPPQPRPVASEATIMVRGFVARADTGTTGTLLRPGRRSHSRACRRRRWPLTRAPSRDVVRRS